MIGELTAATPGGARFAALAESLARETAGAAAEHDRAGTFPHESFSLLRRHGYFAAPLPEQFGGLGASSALDVVVASSRLARSNPSLAIGANMHFAYVLNVVRRWQALSQAGDARRSAAFAATLDELGSRGTVFAAAISEPRQDLARPSTTATRTDDGWRVQGRKIFCTMSPAADTFYVAVTFEDRGSERYGYAVVPRDAAGVVVHDDWDALGMRSSGSNSVSFDDVALPPEALRGGFIVGDSAAYMERNLTAGLFHAAAAAGIAEGAHEATLAALERRPALDGRTEALVAEQSVDLAAVRGTLARASMLVDGTLAPDEAASVALFGETQAAKAFVAEATARIVERALALSGGAGYLNGNPLARAYRDVRAIGFMHPLGSNRAPAVLAEIALNRRPALR